MFAPDLPQAIDVGVVQPEDRIEPRGVGIGHQSGIARSRVGAAHQTVNGVVRLGLDAAVRMGLAVVIEARADAAETLAAALSRTGEMAVAQRAQGDRLERHEDLAVVARPVTLRHEQRIVAAPVRPVRRREGGRQAILVGFEIIPVGQRPVGRPAGSFHGVAHHRLEGEQITTVPGQEVPAGVLALIPEGRDVRCARHRFAALEIAELLPQLAIDPVDRTEETPRGRLLQRARLHRLDAARIPQDRSRPIAAELPDVLPRHRHGAFSLQVGQRTRAGTNAGIGSPHPGVVGRARSSPREGPRRRVCPPPLLTIVCRRGCARTAARDVSSAARRAGPCRR